MTVKTLIPVTDVVPKKQTTAAYTSSELDRVEKRWKYHKERLTAMLYDEVAGNLNHGRMIPYPLGFGRPKHPFGIKFIYEHHKYLVIFPATYTDDTRVIICTEPGVERAEVQRAAHFFADNFNTEYRRFYQTSIADSKERKRDGE